MQGSVTMQVLNYLGREVLVELINKAESRLDFQDICDACDSVGVFDLSNADIPVLGDYLCELNAMIFAYADKQVWGRNKLGILKQYRDDNDDDNKLGILPNY